LLRRGLWVPLGIPPGCLRRGHKPSKLSEHSADRERGRGGGQPAIPNHFRCGAKVPVTGLLPDRSARLHNPSGTRGGPRARLWHR